MPRSLVVIKQVGDEMVCKSFDIGDHRHTPSVLCFCFPYIYRISDKIFRRVMSSSAGTTTCSLRRTGSGPENSLPMPLPGPFGGCRCRIKGVRQQGAAA